MSPASGQGIASVLRISGVPKELIVGVLVARYGFSQSGACTLVANLDEFLLIHGNTCQNDRSCVVIRYTGNDNFMIH